MVANMGISVNQPQHSSSKIGSALDHHQFAWLLTADTSCKAQVGDSHHSEILSPESSNSWEARAFAEDASSLAAGIWPPRAYPCSFCRREFRSAQALGGHMNVHRRDRARLRRSSPPPPFRVPLNNPQSGSLIQAQQDTSTSLNPTARPNLYPNASLLKLNSLPNALAISSISSGTSSASLAANYPSDIAASFPLRLHILASEAASALKFPQSDSSDLLSLWPASASNSTNGCHYPKTGASIKGTAIHISSSPLSSSSTVSCVAPSTRETPCRRAGNIIQSEDESPKKKSNTANSCGFQPYQIIKFTNSSHGVCHAHQTQVLETISVDETVHIEHKRDACGEVDLELRLGRRPP